MLRKLKIPIIKHGASQAPWRLLIGTLVRSIIFYWKPQSSMESPGTKNKEFPGTYFPRHHLCFIDKRTEIQNASDLTF